ncbi:MAG: hypothetical protein D6800_04855 [Candidatus Zixiibacteriota bacterium]|nr:MAG: hypothetical protein D6800_04855 [candidate division Zixibacteria bacterium]
MQYGQLINRAFHLTWHYKSLWIFGFFAGMGMNTDFHLGPSDQQLKSMAEALQRNEFPLTQDQLLAMFGAGMAIMLIFLITRLIASPALVDGVNKIARGGVYNFAEAFSRGVDFLWREFLLAIVAIGLGLAIIIAVVAIVVGSVVVTPYLLILGIPVALLIFFAGLFVLYNTISLGERAMVVRDTGIGQAIEEGYILLRKNLGVTFVFFLVNMGLLIGIAILVGMVFAMIGLPLLGYFSDPDIATLSKVLVGLVIFGPLSVVFGGWSGTFFHALYTLFYFELLEPHAAQPVTTTPGGFTPPATTAG